MSTKYSQLFLPQLGNRSSLNPSCFKEKQRLFPCVFGEKRHYPGRQLPLFFAGNRKIAGFASEGLQTLSCKCRAVERPLKALSIRQSHQHFSENFGDFSRKTIPLLGGVGPAGASLPGDFSPGKNIIEKGKRAGAGAPKGSPC